MAPVRTALSHSFALHATRCPPSTTARPATYSTHPKAAGDRSNRNKQRTTQTCALIWYGFPDQAASCPNGHALFHGHQTIRFLVMVITLPGISKELKKHLTWHFDGVYVYMYICIYVYMYICMIYAHTLIGFKCFGEMYLDCDIDHPVGVMCPVAAATTHMWLKSRRQLIDTTSMAIP